MSKTCWGCNSLLVRTIGFALLVALSVAGTKTKAAEKPRLFVLTDIGGDPDDQMSMVRLMTYANHIDIEGLVADRRGQSVRIEKIVEAYGKVRDNLELHEPGFPKADDLMACVAQARRESRRNSETRGHRHRSRRRQVDIQLVAVLRDRFR